MASEQVKVWIAEAEALGYKDDDLRSYVMEAKKEKAVEEREERKAKRDHEKMMKELEDKQLYEQKANEQRRQLELEEVKLKHEIQKEEATLALRLKEQQSKVEITKQKLEMQEQFNVSAVLDNADDDDGNHILGGQQRPNRRYIPHLPKFDEKKDDMDSFLFRFEQHAHFMGWKKESWSNTLSTLLTGSGVDVFRCLGVQAMNYDVFKIELLKRYRCTQEGFRDRFRQARPENDEAFSSFVTRCKRLLERWMAMANVTPLTDDQSFVFILEQVSNACRRELVTHIKLWKPTTLEKLIEIGESYTDANKGKKLQKEEVPSSAFSVSQPTALRGGGFRGQGENARSNHRGGFRGQRGSFRGQRRDSFKEQSEGALTGQNGGAVRGQTRGSVRGQNRGSGIVCFRCGGKGHVVTKCPTPATNVAMKMSYVKFTNPLDDVLPKKHNDNFANVESGLLFEKGKVNNIPVSFVRDTGCQVVGVRASLVKKSQYLGENMTCKNFSGSQETFPLACIQIDTPYFTGDVVACVIQSPVADLILGNVGSEVQWRSVNPSNQFQNIQIHACTAAEATDDKPMIGDLNLCEGSLDGTPVSVLRDTGCTTAGVRGSLVKDSAYTGETVSCKTFGGKIETFKTAVVDVSTPFFQGLLTCCVLDNPCADLILGNIPGINAMPAACVVTRAQAAKQNRLPKPLACPQINIDVDKDKLRKLQTEEASFKKFFAYAQKGEVFSRKSKATVRFRLIDGILYRVFDNGETTTQLLVPTPLRDSVLLAAHDAPLAGHTGVRRTLRRILNSFFWPTVRKDATHYCKTCDICQKTTDKGRVRPVPLITIPSIEQPFKRVAIDLVGEIKPASASGHRYILTLVDMATRFPEAVPLKSIDSVTVAEALIAIFSRMGFPEQILSDNGSQFVSELMKQVFRLLAIRPVHTTPYHPQANGRVERFNGSLKKMLRRVSAERPKDWDRYIPSVLFAYREMPNESTGFSPFELMFGRAPRGPVDILKDVWTGQDVKEEDGKSVYQYVFDLQNKLAETCRLARENAEKSSQKYTFYHDQKARLRTFKVGDQVLVLLPDSHNKLLMKWLGPFRVISVRGPVNYLIAMDDRTCKVFHTNMLKLYETRTKPCLASTSVSNNGCKGATRSDVIADQKERSESVPAGNTTNSVGHVSVKACSDQKIEACSDHVMCMLPYSQCEDLELPTTAVAVIPDDSEDDVVHIPTLCTVQKETVSDVKFDPLLEPKQHEEFFSEMREFSDCLRDRPCTKTPVCCVGPCPCRNFVSGLKL
jgi:hypothetical protein